jgi:hypothetical protein
LLVAAGLFGIGARPDAARAASRSDAPVALSPASGSQLDRSRAGYAVAVQPGGGVWQSVVVESNVDDGRITVRLSGTGAAGAWAHPSTTTLVLAPHQREQVPFTVAPPHDAPAGHAGGALVATIVDTDGRAAAGTGATAALDLRVNVVGGTGSAASQAGATGAASRAARTADPRTVESVAPRRRDQPASTSDTVLMIVVVGALVLLVLAMIVPPAVRSLRARHRERARPAVGRVRLWLLRACERVRATRLRRRTTRVAEAASAGGTLPTVAPPALSRADVRHAEQLRRSAERFEQVQEERRVLREEAQRAAAEAWQERVRAMRERAEREARERAEAIENARRLRAQRAAELAAERRAAEERRLEQVRANEARRREEAAERARRRADEFAARRRIGHEANAAMRKDVVEEELHQRRETELSRAAVVQLRSEEAREIARSWMIESRPANDADAPAALPGELRAIESLLVTLPPPGAGSTVTVEEFDDGDVEVTDDATVATPRPRGKVAVTALDVDALNARLRGS